MSDIVRLARSETAEWQEYVCAALIGLGAGHGSSHNLTPVESPKIYATAAVRMADTIIEERRKRRS